MDENPYAENAAYYATRDTIRALESMTDEEFETVNATDRDGYDNRQSKYRICRSCGQSGYAGQYPFSTLGGEPTCDDCV